MITKEQQEVWAESNTMKKGVLLYLPDFDLFISVFFGDGSNLNPKDVWHNDYIHMTSYKYDTVEFAKVHEGMIRFNNEKGTVAYKDYHESLQHFINDSLEFIGFCPTSCKNCMILKIYA